MQRYSIVLFIFSTIAALALLCAVFPEDGVSIGNIQLNFPSVSDILTGTSASAAESPEALLERRARAAAAGKERFLEWFANDSARFDLPGGDLTFFDPLFEAFDRAGEEKVRIVHYGDSQLEEDRMTGTVRNALQQKFGGGGVGMLPIKEYFTLNEGEGATAQLPSYMVFADAEHRAGNNRYGPMGQFTRLDSAITVSFWPMKGNTGAAKYFNRITLIAGTPDGSLGAACRNSKATIAQGKTYSRTVFELRDSTTKASLSLSGRADLYAVLLDNATGICVDNVAMRGCAGTIFTAISSHQLSSFYRDENVRLIIMQYGGNVVPYVKTDAAISDYKASVQKQIRYLQGLAPDALIIFIGPSDMATSIKGKRQTWPHLKQLTDSLRAGVTQAGAAYWDLYAAMGGENSMVQWVSAKPPLAGSDYIHFTPRGSEFAGQMFSNSLLFYYDYYRWRKENENEK